MWKSIFFQNFKNGLKCSDMWWNAFPMLEVPIWPEKFSTIFPTEKIQIQDFFEIKKLSFIHTNEITRILIKVTRSKLNKICPLLTLPWVIKYHLIDWCMARGLTSGGAWLARYGAFGTSNWAGVGGENVSQLRSDRSLKASSGWCEDGGVSFLLHRWIRYFWRHS